MLHGLLLVGPRPGLRARRGQQGQHAHQYIHHANGGEAKLGQRFDAGGRGIVNSGKQVVSNGHKTDGRAKYGIALRSNPEQRLRREDRATHKKAPSTTGRGPQLVVKRQHGEHLAGLYQKNRTRTCAGTNP